MKKYELIKTDIKDIVEPDGQVIRCYRIKALRKISDFPSVEEGTLGGYIENEDCLSHDGTCWVYEGATVYKGSRVEGSAMVKGDTVIKNNSIIKDNAEVRGTTIIDNNCLISGFTYIGGYVKISNGVNLHSCFVSDYAEISEDLILRGPHDICGDACIRSKDDILTVLSGDGANFTFFRTKDGTINFGVKSIYNTPITEFMETIRRHNESFGRLPNIDDYEKILNFAKDYFNLK